LRSPEGKTAATSSDDLTMRCAQCRSMQALYVCARCRATRFCSPVCQRAAWPQHQSQCRAAGVAEGGSGLSRISDRMNGWIGLLNTDALAGQDVATFQLSSSFTLEAAQRKCQERGCGGLVVWRGQVYLRAQLASELLMNIQYSAGATLWLHVADLSVVAGRQLALRLDIPEVVVRGSRPVPKLAGLSMDEMSSYFASSKPLVLADAQHGWPAQQKWNFGWLARNYGDEEMICSDLAPFFSRKPIATMCRL